MRRVISIDQNVLKSPSHVLFIPHEAPLFAEIADEIDVLDV
jgi:hypothetical protein